MTAEALSAIEADVAPRSAAADGPPRSSTDGDSAPDAAPDAAPELAEARQSVVDVVAARLEQGAAPDGAGANGQHAGGPDTEGAPPAGVRDGGTAPDGARHNRPQRAGEAPSGEARSGEARSAEARSGEARSGEARSGEARSGEARSGEARSVEARSVEARSVEARSVEARSAEARSGEARSGEGPSGGAPDGPAADASAEPQPALEPAGDAARFAATAVLDVLRASGWADAGEAQQLRAEADRLRELLDLVVRDHRAREASAAGVENQQHHWLIPLLRAAHGVAFGSLGAKVALRTAVQDVPEQILASAGLRIDYGVENTGEPAEER